MKACSGKSCGENKTNGKLIIQGNNTYLMVKLQNELKNCISKKGINLKFEVKTINTENIDFILEKEKKSTNFYSIIDAKDKNTIDDQLIREILQNFDRIY